MKILVTGRGGAGSWIVRGEQLGAAMGATVKANASLDEMKAHDAILVIKKFSPGMLQNLRKSGKPWAYDILDAYPQPECGMWSEDQSKEWLRRHLAELQPDRVVWPNREMAGTTGAFVVYHHHRPKIKKHRVRERIQVVGYEGSAKYLDLWLAPIAAECARRSLKFVYNPAHIADLDVVLAIRGGVWDGWAQRHWKSNVKLANAHGSVRPFIGANECGYHETACGAEYWADSAKEVARALDWLEGYDTRVEVNRRFLAEAYPVEAAAEDMLCALKF